MIMFAALGLRHFLTKLACLAFGAQPNICRPFDKLAVLKAIHSRVAPCPDVTILPAWSTKISQASKR